MQPELQADHSLISNSKAVFYSFVLSSDRIYCLFVCLRFQRKNVFILRRVSGLFLRVYNFHIKKEAMRNEFIELFHF
jgi:lipid-A-disaccharide synthase-like uncharacterized protein